jgi:hypothetical protein
MDNTDILQGRPYGLSSVYSSSSLKEGEAKNIEHVIVVSPICCKVAGNVDSQVDYSIVYT